MKIAPISYYPKFTSTYRTEYKNPDGTTCVADYQYDRLDSVACSNYTNFFREDLFFPPIKKNFKNLSSNIEKIVSLLPQDKKINVYDFACSDGSEAYSIAICLMELLGDKAKNFFPIHACDKDYDKLASDTSQICATDNDLAKISIFSNAKLTQYFPDMERCEEKGKFLLRPSEELKNAVEFKNANLIDEINKIDTKNNLIFIRNVLPYLTKNELAQLAKGLAKLDMGTVVVVGNFDLVNNFSEYRFAYNFLKSIGYTPCDVYGDDLIYKKTKVGFC